MAKESKRARCVDHQLRVGFALLYHKKHAAMVYRIGMLTKKKAKQKQNKNTYMLFLCSLMFKNSVNYIRVKNGKFLTENILDQFFQFLTKI